MKHICNKVKIEDSSASPFIEQKDVILCRSGIQLYSYNEVKDNLGEPPVKKDFYKEYRPTNVIVKAQDLCRSLPVTKEHPDVWVNQDNWKDLAGGVLDKEVSVVALDDEADGEIGIKSNITFYTRELYDYYMNNKEVSLGYECKKHFVENTDELGYDILLDEITTVNHLAITRAGRGGSSVAVIDSIIGGLRPMRTGIFAWLKGKKQTDSAPSSFGREVLDSVKNSKGTTEEEIANEMKGVMDSMSILKDCEAKDTLLDVVKDCFDNREKAFKNEEELTKTLDSMWVDIHSDSISEIAMAFSKLGKSAEKTVEPTTDIAEAKDAEKSDEKTDDKSETKDSEETEKSAEKTDDKSETKESEEADEKEKSDEKDGCNKDSAVVRTKDDILTAVKDSLKPMVIEAVKEVLGLKENNKTVISGGVVDSAIKGNDEVRDYSSFLN